MKKQHKVGIMGGTFNPIHTAHLILAEHAYEQYELDTVLIMPSKNPPHKDNDEILPEENRVTMIEMAIKDNPHFELSRIELKREGTTYTVDTLEYLTSQYEDTEFYFIIGGDSLYQIDTWKNPERIFQLCHILAATRYGLEKEVIKERIEELKIKYHGNIDLLDTPNLDISSKFIRTQVKDGKSIKYYVVNEVENYIYEQGFYLS